ncbi:MAG: XTP/dITP diphosphatase [Ignavibacteriaceae bacterium]
MKILIATGNRGKFNEIKSILASPELDLVSFYELDNTLRIEETGESFRENALIKARKAFEMFGIPAVGDDSGLMVEQLDGAPGIYSARYAGINATDEDNNKKLITELSKFPKPHKAKYFCSAVYYDGKNYKFAEGELIGELTDKPRGSNGFGYDPYFIPEGYNKTVAELDPDEKNRISHRYKAFSKLKELIIQQEK